jgi:hypothetical protein
MFLSSKARPVRKADNHLWADCLDNLSFLRLNHIGLHGLLREQLYILLLIVALLKHILTPVTVILGL